MTAIKIFANPNQDVRPLQGRKNLFSNAFYKCLTPLGLLAAILLSIQTTCHAQDTIITPEKYIQNYKDLAIDEMKRTGVPASITLAQGLFESGNGNSFLAKPPYNNHFGIKCKTGWTGRSVKVDDDELQECFRAYDRVEDSYMDHSNFLTCQSRYAFLLQLDPTDYKAWAFGLKQAGYATNPKYPEKLIEKIEKYNLYQYDIGNTKTPPIAGQEPPEHHILLTQKERENSFTFRNIPAYVIQPGDNYGTIADEHNMMRWELRVYNDLGAREGLKPGTILYLKPKHRKGETPFRTVKDGEGMYYISQDEGIKLKMLYKWNRMKKGEEPAPGAVLNLQHKRESKPAVLGPGTIVLRKGVRLIPEPATGPKPDFKAKCPPTDFDSAKTAPPSSVKTMFQSFDKLRSDSSLLFTPSKHKIKNDSSIKMMTTEPVYPTIDGTDVNGKYHIAQKGETIYGIAKNNGLRYDSLIKWNNIMGTISEGVKIYLVKPKNYMEPVKIYQDNSTKSIDNQSTPDTSTQYIVRTGDTLYSISKKFNVTIQQLKDWNGLTDNSISIGQSLKVGK